MMALFHPQPVNNPIRTEACGARPTRHSRAAALCEALIQDDCLPHRRKLLIQSPLVGELAVHRLA
jgi:hypothetical protein